MSELVTGEAVALDVRLARFPSRAIALALDIGLELTVLVVLTWIVGAVGEGVDGALFAAVWLVVVVGCLVGIPVTMETLSHGRSLGKLALGLRVVRDDGGPARFRHALVRGLAAFFIDIWMTLGAVGCITSLASVRGKRVGDHLAGTVVVRERVPVKASVQTFSVAMPASLAGWAVAADLSRVPDDLALHARSLLARAPSLDAATRARLTAAAATEIARYVSPSSPPGTPAEWYLAAVVAERSRRARAAAPAAMAIAPAPTPAAAATPAPAQHPAPPPPDGGFALPY